MRRGLLPRRLGLDHPPRRRRHPAGRTRHTRWSTKFAPASLGAALGITLDAAKQLIADALELTYRLPRLWTLVVAGLVPVWLARTDLPRDPRPVRRSRRLRRPAHLRDPRQGPPGQRHPAGRRSAAVLRPRPSRRGRTTTNCTKRGVWVHPGGSTGHHRRVHDPRHPRRRALRPDHPPHRRRARRPRRHRQPRHPQSTGGRDPRRPPTRSRPPVRPRRRCTRPSAVGQRTSTSTSPRTTSTGTGAVAIEKLGAATTDLLADWLTRHTAAGGESHRPPVLDLGSDRPPSTSTTHPRRCANRSSCATATASSPAADATPGPATSTTSPPYIPIEDGGPPGQTNPLNLGTPVSDPPPDQDLHRLGLQTPRRRTAPTSGPHRPGTSTRCTPTTPAPTTAKNLTPRHPGPAPAGASGTPSRDPFKPRRTHPPAPDHQRPQRSRGTTARRTKASGTPAQPQADNDHDPVNPRPGPQTLLVSTSSTSGGQAEPPANGSGLRLTTRFARCSTTGARASGLRGWVVGVGDLLG